MKSTIILFLFSSLFLNYQTHAQPTTDDQKRLSISIHAPMGGSLTYQCKSKLALRLGYSTLKDNTFELNTNLNDKPVYMQGKFAFSNWSAMFELGGWIHLNFGAVGVLSKDLMTTQVNLKTNNAGGNIVISNESGIKPAVGFGFGRPIPRRRIGFGIDFNGIYLGKKLSVSQYDGTAPFKQHLPQDNIQSDLDNLMTDLQNIIPTTRFRFTVRLK